MSPEQFEASAREGLGAKGESPSAAHDAAILAAAYEACGENALRRRAARRHWWMPISVAAAVGVVAVGLWSAIDRGSTSDDTLRGAANGEVLPANGATLERAPVRFDWQEQPGAATYRVTLRAADASVIWQSESTAQSQAVIPAQLQIARGARYLWSVEYGGPATAGSIGPYSFRIADENR